MWFIGVGVEQETTAPPPKKNRGSAPGKFIYNRTYNLVHYIFGMTNYHKIEIVIRNSRCFQNLHRSGAAKKYLGYERFEILYLQNGIAFTCCAISF